MKIGIVGKPNDIKGLFKYLSDGKTIIKNEEVKTPFFKQYRPHYFFKVGDKK